MLDVIVKLIEISKIGIKNWFEKFVIKFIPNKRIGWNIFVVAIFPVVRTNVVKSGTNKFIKFVSLLIVFWVIFNISKKLLITTVEIKIYST